MLPKYMVLKIKELRNFLTTEEQAQFNELMQKLAAKKVEANVQSPHYFVLNMNDKFALPATETYIEEIDADVEARGQVGVRAARKAAWDAREWAINNTDGSKVPT